MQKTDREVLELCQSWFKDIMERSEKLTSGNVAHERAAIRGVAKNYAEFVAEHLKERWEPSEEMLEALYKVIPENVMAISEDEMLLDKLYQGLKYGRVLSKN